MAASQSEPFLEPESGVSPDFPFTLHNADILGSKMAYIDTQPGGSGPTALFIHGNPTSSYMWRNVIPHVSPLMRCVAPDLIGMGKSSKVENLAHHFTDHFAYLSKFIEVVIPSGQVLLVIHDWGSALGLHWAHRQTELSGDDSPSRVLGIVLMEFLRPFPTWEDFSEGEAARETFKAFRTPGSGRKLLIEENIFVERVFPRGVIRGLTEIEMDAYREPFLKPVDREPTWAWPNQIPIEQKPDDVHDIATRYHDWLMSTEVPKLLLWATPGFMVSVRKAQWYIENLKNVRGVCLGRGSHFLSEDHPRSMGVGIHDWVMEVVLAKVR